MPELTDPHNHFFKDIVARPEQADGHALMPESAATTDVASANRGNRQDGCLEHMSDLVYTTR